MELNEIIKFKPKKLAVDAGRVPDRVLELMEEKKELHEYLKLLTDRARTSKKWRKKILQRMETILTSDLPNRWSEELLRSMEEVPTTNPDDRIEDFFVETIDEKRPNRLSILEYLSNDMVKPWGNFGPETAYGNAFINFGQCQQQLGKNERDFIKNTANFTMHSMIKFVDGEMKDVKKKLAILETKKLNLDACKNRVWKTRNNMVDQHNAQSELAVAQSEFARQARIVIPLLEDIINLDAEHLESLYEFMKAQLCNYAQSHPVMQDLYRKLDKYPDLSRDRTLRYNLKLMKEKYGSIRQY